MHTNDKYVIPHCLLIYNQISYCSDRKAVDLKHALTGFTVTCDYSTIMWLRRQTQRGFV